MSQFLVQPTCSRRSAGCRVLGPGIRRPRAPICDHARAPVGPSLPDLDLPRIRGEDQHDGETSQEAQVLDDKRDEGAALAFVLLADFVHLRELGGERKRERAAVPLGTAEVQEKSGRCRHCIEKLLYVSYAKIYIKMVT